MTFIIWYTCVSPDSTADTTEDEEKVRSQKFKTASQKLSNIQNFMSLNSDTRSPTHVWRYKVAKV